MGNKQAAETARQKYGEDFHARNGSKGGKAHVKKGFAMYLERMTVTERLDFYKKRNEKRWSKDAGKKT